MRFSTAFLVSGFAAAFANAQVFFTMSTLPVDIAPGTNYQITWANGPGTSTVSIQLVQGDPQSLKTIATIASGQAHAGSYTWTPSASLASGSDYAFKIVDDVNGNLYNYSDRFGIKTAITGSNTQSVASSTAASSSAASSSAASSSSASVTSLTGTRTSSSAATTGTSSAVSSQVSSGTTTRASLTGSTTTSSATRTGTAPAINGAKSLQVGGGLLAAVAGVMIAM